MFEPVVGLILVISKRKLKFIESRFVLLFGFIRERINDINSTLLVLLFLI